jgi:hypothetical protein
MRSVSPFSIVAVTKAPSERLMGDLFRKLVLVVVGIAVLGPTALPTAVSAASPRERIVVLLRRTTSGPSSFEFSASFQLHERGAFVGSLDAHVGKRGPLKVWPGLVTSVSGRDGVSVSVNGSSANSCDRLNLCTGSDFGGGGYAITYEDKEGSDPVNFVLVVVEGKGIVQEFRGVGWTSRVVGWRYRYIDGSEADSVSVSSGSFEGAEVFFEATAPGGRFGSLAVAWLPCSTSNSEVVPRGVGNAVLTGGIAEEELGCAGDDRRPAAASWAKGSTAWRLTGTTVGDTTLRETRLFVVDLPRRFLRTLQARR